MRFLEELGDREEGPFYYIKDLELKTNIPFNWESINTTELTDA